MNLREQKKRALRNTLIRNAVQLFCAHGYDQVNLDEIVGASMCSRSTFHRYFGAKEDLLFPTVAEQLEGLVTALAIDTGEDPWMLARREVSAALCGFLDAFEPDLRARCIALWLDEPAPRRRYLEIVMDWERVLNEFLARHPAFSDAMLLERQLVASSITSALRAALNTAMQTGDDVARLVDRAFDILELGIRAHLSPGGAWSAGPRRQLKSARVQSGR